MKSSEESGRLDTPTSSDGPSKPLGMKFPPGYCLDPNGKVIAPEGKGEDFSFGYDIGFREAWDILSRAQKAAKSGAAS